MAIPKARTFIKMRMSTRPLHRRAASNARAFALAAAFGLLFAGAVPDAARAQVDGYGQTVGGSSTTTPGSFDEKEDSILDATNPLQLMNMLRKSAALEDATPPGSAIDDALRDFEAQTASPAPSSGATQTMTGP